MALNEALLQGLVERISEAAPLPAVVHKVLELTADPKSSAADLAEAVSSDPVISAKLVHTANSAFFGLVHKTSDIQGAIARLGMKNVRNAVTGLSVKGLLGPHVEVPGFSRLRVWQHSVATAIFCELLCAASREPRVRELASEAFLAGLVHDIGIILEDQYAGTRLADLAKEAWTDRKPLHSLESGSLGFDHQDLGSAVLRKWRFPAQLADAIARHHRPRPSKDAALEQITALGEMLAATKKVGYHDVHGLDKQLLSRVAEQLGLISERMAEVNSKFEQRLPQAMEILSAGAGG
jgi:putative nucleotidyltransferase with HDIG domain